MTAIADADRSEPPIACTLEGAAVRERLAQWADVLGLSRRRVTLPSGVVRVEFADSIDVAELARLVSAEQHCCAFFRFAITVDTRGVGLEVDAPTDALDLVAGMFGESGSPDEPSPRLDRVN